MSDWVNLGGQLIPAEQVDALRQDIREGRRGTWDEIHADYDRLWCEYPHQRRLHATATLVWLTEAGKLTRQAWAEALEEAAAIQRLIALRVYDSRKKDYDDPFRRALFASDAERLAVLGDVEDNEFIRQVRQETEATAARLEALRRRV